MTQKKPVGNLKNTSIGTKKQQMLDATTSSNGDAPQQKSKSTSMKKGTNGGRKTYTTQEE